MAHFVLLLALVLGLISLDALTGRHYLATDGRQPLGRSPARWMFVWAVALAAWSIPSIVSHAEDRAAGVRAKAAAATQIESDAVAAERQYRAHLATLTPIELRAVAMALEEANNREARGGSNAK